MTGNDNKSDLKLTKDDVSSLCQAWWWRVDGMKFDVYINSSIYEKYDLAYISV